MSRSKQRTAEEVAERWPEAVQVARLFREVFDEARLFFALNKQGAELGKPSAPVRKEIVALRAKAGQSPK